MLKSWISSVAAIASLASVIILAAPGDDGRCQLVLDAAGRFRCSAQAGGSSSEPDPADVTSRSSDLDKPANPSMVDRTEPEQSTSARTRSINSLECAYQPLVPMPAPNDPRWEGNDSTTGQLEVSYCNGPEQYRYVPNGPQVGPAPPPPPPDPAVLAQQAYTDLEIPQPSIGAGPDRTKLAVNLWTWLWVDNPGQLIVTVTAGAVSVTATATLASVTWTLGEPAAQGDTYQQGSPATITCQGAGTAPPASYDWKAQPPCGYKYHWRSLKERTGGTGTWPITATTNWSVTWQSNTGVTGGTTLNASSNDQFDIGEYRTVLVQGPGG